MEEQTGGGEKADIFGDAHLNLRLVRWSKGLDATRSGSRSRQEGEALRLSAPPEQY